MLRQVAQLFLSSEIGQLLGVKKIPSLYSEKKSEIRKLMKILIFRKSKIYENFDFFENRNFFEKSKISFFFILIFEIILSS